MDQDAIIQYVDDTFAGVDVLRPTDGPGSGDTFFIYDPERNLEGKQQFPFATIVAKDYGEFDNASQLDRPGVFRLNVGVGHDRLQALFGPQTSAEDESAGHDYAALDRLMPHPVYASHGWVSVLNPSEATFETVKPLLAEAYAAAVARHPSNRARGA